MDKDISGNKVMPSMEEFLQLRKNKNAMRLLADEIIPCVMGKLSNRRTIETEVSLSNYVTVSDEGFAVLALENIYDTFMQIDIDKYYSPKKEGETKCLSVKGKYTMWGEKAKRFGGWSENGINRFNELCKIINKDRAEDKNKWEEEYRQEKESKLNEEKKWDQVDHMNNNPITEVYDDLE